MKYLYLLYADESKMPAPDSPQMQQKEAAFGRYYEELSGRGMFKGGDPVQPSKTATTVRVRNGSTKTASGPVTTGSEQVIGFYVIEAKNQDEAVAYAAKVPSASVGWRPIRCKRRHRVRAPRWHPRRSGPWSPQRPRYSRWAARARGRASR